MKRCIYCNNKINHRIYNPNTKSLEDVCAVCRSQIKGGEYISAIDNTKYHINNIEKCEICGTRGINIDRKPRLIKHHTSYTRDETIKVCDKCHADIHAGYYPDLLPEDNRPLTKGELMLKKLRGKEE